MTDDEWIESLRKRTHLTRTELAKVWGLVLQEQVHREMLSKQIDTACARIHKLEMYRAGMVGAVTLLGVAFPATVAAILKYA